MKLEFIGIVANHEHLVPLSLPLFCSKTDRRKWPTDKGEKTISLLHLSVIHVCLLSFIPYRSQLLGRGRNGRFYPANQHDRVEWNLASNQEFWWFSLQRRATARPIGWQKRTRKWWDRPINRLISIWSFLEQMRLSCGCLRIFVAFTTPLEWFCSCSVGRWLNPLISVIGRFYCWEIFWLNMRSTPDWKEKLVKILLSSLISFHSFFSAATKSSRLSILSAYQCCPHAFGLIETEWQQQCASVV